MLTTYPGRKSILGAFLLVFSGLAMAGNGSAVSYQVNGQSYEGYYVSPGANAPLVLLIHDWDGLTDYEVQRFSR